ncbi:MAG TPA: calcium-binding protein [Thermoleophilaceae bacterium]|nr:calcium-binding protein [Thermoleophilaceae bacterium]
MRVVSIGIAAMILLVPAAPSHAATVVALEWGDKYGTYRDVIVDAKPGEANDIHVEGGYTGTRVTDSVPLTAEFGCAAQPDGSVFCPDAGARVKVDAGDLDDRVTVDVASARLIGGEGNDVLVSTARFGRPTFTGGAGDDRMVLVQGEGDFLEGAQANGADVISAGPHSDPRVSGPASTVSYAERVLPVRVELDGDADDGEAGEHDQIVGNLAVVGGAGPDRLTGNDGPNTLMGKRGDDVLTGGPGLDTLFGGNGDDVLRGGGGRDVLRGNRGRDRLLPGAGGLSSWGGPGNDVILAGGGSVDSIDCGPGWDRVRNDDFDLFQSRTCERRDR